MVATATFAITAAEHCMSGVPHDEMPQNASDSTLAYDALLKLQAEIDRRVFRDAM